MDVIKNMDSEVRLSMAKALGYEEGSMLVAKIKKSGSTAKDETKTTIQFLSTRLLNDPREILDQLRVWPQDADRMKLLDLWDVRYESEASEDVRESFEYFIITSILTHGLTPLSKTPDRPAKKECVVQTSIDLVTPKRYQVYINLDDKLETNRFVNDSVQSGESQKSVHMNVMKETHRDIFVCEKQPVAGQKRQRSTSPQGTPKKARLPFQLEVIPPLTDINGIIFENLSKAETDGVFELLVNFGGVSLLSWGRVGRQFPTEYQDKLIATVCIFLVRTRGDILTAIKVD